MAIAKMTVADLERFLHVEFPQAFSGGDISIESADGVSCLLRQHYSDQMLRPGGTISGPTLMALADFAMYVVLLSAIGPVGLAVTTQHQFSAQGPARAGRACGGEAFETGQAACGRRDQSAVGNVAGSYRPCDINLFHSKSLGFSTVI
jgi:acyl-coenzyme A thioesterase PaaI-like protein